MHTAIRKKNGLLVADSLVSKKPKKSCLKVLNTRSEAINLYHDSKIAHYTDLRHQIQLSGLFNSKERPQHQEFFELGKYTSLDGAKLSSEEKKKLQIIFDKQNRLFLRSSTDLGFLDEIRH